MAIDEKSGSWRDRDRDPLVGRLGRHARTKGAEWRPRNGSLLWCRVLSHVSGEEWTMYRCVWSSEDFVV